MTFVGAGDIASSGTGDEATAAVLDGIPGPSSPSATPPTRTARPGEYAAYYAPTWGRHKSRTIPSVGNHEYNTGAPQGYFDYFGAAAGDPAQGYYSTNSASWHVIVLNSNCAIVSCSAGSAQEQWLREDLAANPAQCTVALFHHPRFSSGASHGNNSAVAPFWNALYEFNADLVLNGHDHDYERFAPQNPNAVADPAAASRSSSSAPAASGIDGFSTIQPNSQVRGSSLGVLKLTLKPTSYDFQFVPVAGQTFTDAGSGTCH